MLSNPPSTQTSIYKDRLFQGLVIGIIVIGVILRASKYLPGWSMRGDELGLTSNLINRSPLLLITKPLDFEQAAPIGFLLLEKLLITFFGASDYVLRLPAFLAGCLSLIAMQKLLTITNGKYGNLFALSAFAFGDYLIYYSAELKQYSTDVLICLALLLIFNHHLSKEATKKDFIILGAAGVLAICSSHPAIFVVIPIGLALFLYYLPDRQKLTWLTITGLVWAAVFLSIYLILLRYQTTSTYLITFWGNLRSYMPLRPWRDWAWFPDALIGLFLIVAGLASGLIPALLVYLTGLWAFLQEKKWQWALVLTMPLVLNIIVSGFQKFPFHGRLILYLVPLSLVLLAKGIDALLHLIPNRAMAVSVFVVISFLFLKNAIPTANAYLFTQSYVNDDLKPILSFIENHSQKNDLVYLYHYASGTYTYYADSYDLQDLEVIQGQNYSGNAKKYRDEIGALPRGQRIWFVFSFVGETKVKKGVKRDEREYILAFLKEHGEMIEEYYSTNNASSAHLFILR